ncbi:unnamed protein product [Miscanthus lutarioriparius]|uniref:F-box domain-containing protein n=1 Tax=Miscanthus lutarioriparius TaxID=422564 RepID=A0A811NRB9_9POAL|nr:unnamed protein product [Miscanthus lutarioriparius]
MAAPSSPDPAALMDELVEECLVRLPPEDRAALVSRQWHRVVTGAIFRRRYIEFPHSAPQLGYMLNQDNNSIRFVPTSSFLRPQVDRRDVRAIHSRHGRVLLLSAREREGDGLGLLVWDPRKDKQWELPVLQPGARIANWDAALACAVGNGCSHLDCHFKVVFVGRSGGRRTCVGYFTIDLNSGRSKKVGNVLGSGRIVPYVSFCTPAPGTVSTDEGPAASVVVSTDDEPGAGVVVSRDEGLGDVAVSTDEGPGDVVVSKDEGPGSSMSSA